MSTDNTTEIESVELDCEGLLCPLPVYKAALVLDKLESGARLRLITTDPGALQDIPAMTRQRGDTLVSADDEGGRQLFVIEKGTRR
ncbi:MAG TPA: sulfurtransferase TusA family protein [Acidimicrobiia bacterium]|nr:sulfurtransferase TusA family protein [Acidimicrobiia bacterium]